MVATAMTAAAAASERSGGEARAHVHRTALGTVAGRARGAGRGLRSGIGVPVDDLGWGDGLITDCVAAVRGLAVMGLGSGCLPN